MDPDVVLQLLRARLELDDVPDSLAVLVGALDGWLSSGGYLPAAWSSSVTEATFYASAEPVSSN